MLIETETTPNPATLKFLPGRTVMDAGTRDFATPEEAEAIAAGRALVQSGRRDRRVLRPRFRVGHRRARASTGATLKPDVLGILLDHFSANMPLFKPGSAGDSACRPRMTDFADDPADADIVAQIRS